MADPTFNPYNFVSLPSLPPAQSAYPGLDRRVGYTGRLTCQLVAVTRLFTAGPRPDPRAGTPPAEEEGRKLLSFLRDGEGQAMIQGTTLKGMVRSVFEAAYPSCLALAQLDRPSKAKKSGGVEPGYRFTVPEGYAPGTCRDVQLLCPACRLFGMIEGADAHAQGRVAFGDALMPAARLRRESVPLAELSAPKPRHGLIYGRQRRQEDEIAGRKFYYHHRDAVKKFEGRGSSTLIEHAPSGSRFRFTVLVQNLDEEEVRRLVGCLVLDAAHGHKVGMARPLGFGSCRIEIVGAESSLDAAGARYQGWAPPAAPAALVPEDWLPPEGWLRGELAALLKLDAKPGREVGYLRYGGYTGMGIDAGGRFVAASPGTAATGPAAAAGETAPGGEEPPDRPPEVTPEPPGGGMERLRSLAGPEPENQAPEKRKGKRGDRITVEVVSVANAVYTLRDVETGHEIIHRGVVPWKIGDRREVRVQQRSGDGTVKKIAP